MSELFPRDYMSYKVTLGMHGSDVNPLRESVLYLRKSIPYSQKTSPHALFYVADFAFVCKNGIIEMVKNRTEGKENFNPVISWTEKGLEEKLENSDIEHFLVGFDPSDRMKNYLAVSGKEYFRL